MRFLSFLVLFVTSLTLQAQEFDYLKHLQFGDGEGDDDESRKIAFFQNGDLLVAGQFEGLIDFDPKLTEANLQISLEQSGEPYLVRYSPKGDLIWIKPIRSDRSADIYGLLVDSLDQIFITGSYIQEIIFDEANPNARLSGVSPNDADGYISKFDGNGNFIWAQRFAGTGIDAGIDLEFNSLGELVVFGVFGDSLLFDAADSSSLRVSAGAGDVFCGGYDASNGQFIWVKSFSGLGFDNPRDLEIDSIGNYYLMGDYTSTISFSLNPLISLSSSGGNDIFIAKLSPSRQLLWAEKLAGSSTDLGANLLIAHNNRILISGTFRSNIQLDPAGIQPSFSGTNFNTDVFLLALDSAANFQWANILGGSSTDVAAGLSLRNNEVWIGGYFANSVDFDPDPNQSALFSALGGDGFLAGYNYNNGNYLQAFQLAGSSFSRVLDVAVDANAKIWSVGALYNSTDFDPIGGGFTLSSPSSGNSNSFFASYQSSQFDTAWASQDREGGDDYLYQSKYLQDGSVLLCGSFEGLIDMDLGAGSTAFISRGSQDIYFAKYDANLSFSWALHMGGASFDEATSITEDIAGNVYIAGHYQNSFYFPGANGLDSLVSQSQSSVFLLKYDSQGQFIWAKDIQGLGNEYAYGLSTNSLGQIALSGWMQGSISFTGISSVPNVSNRAAFIAVYDTAGSYQWSQIVDGPSNEYGYACLASESGDFYLTGSYRNTVDFDPGSASDSYTSQAGGNDVFLSKYNSTGQYQWVKVYGQQSFEAGYGLAEDAAQNLYLTGNFSGSQDFDPSAGQQVLNSQGQTDIFLLSLNPSGQFRWVKQIGGSGGDKPSAIAVVDSMVLHTGYFYNTVDLNPGADSLIVSSLGQHAMYLQVLDTLGNYIEAFALDGTGMDIGLSVDYRNGKTIVGGHFERSVDFNPDSAKTTLVRSFGDQDGILVQFGSSIPCPSVYDSIQVNACDSYFWQGQNYSQSGFYQKILISPNGCDSILSLDLNLGTSFDSTLRVSACDSFFWRGNSYYQSGFYWDSLQTAQGCDSSYALQLSINAAFADTLAVSACDSFHWRGNTYFQSAYYYDSLISSQACDSIYVLNLSLYQSSGDSISVNGCDSVIVAGISYYQSGFYTDTLISSNACDSILWISVSIDSLDLGVATNGFTAAALQTNAQYQWLNCDLDYQPISGANTQSFNPNFFNAPSGHYAVALNKGQCRDTSNCVFLQSISLPEWSLAQPEIWPNPSTGLVYVKLDQSSKYSIRLLDSQGRLLKTWDEINPDQNFQCLLPSEKGFYHLLILNETGEYWQETIIRN